MFSNPPKIFAHISALEQGNFVLPEVILNSDHGDVTLLKRFCPHRMYPISDTGKIIDNIVCKFHGFEWDKQGNPVNNDKKLSCGKADVGKSGLVFKDFIEPDSQWVKDLSNETALTYSHSSQGESKGSWLWMMDIEIDLMHVRAGEDVVHPWLSSVEDLDQIELESGDGWVIQTCSTGWWLFIYPFTFIEWSKGCLAINYTIPKDKNNEFGFEWITQFYYDPGVTQERRILFEKMEEVSKEDIQVIEKQKGPYFPLKKSSSRLEDHCVHFGNWVTLNKQVD